MTKSMCSNTPGTTPSSTPGSTRESKIIMLTGASCGLGGALVGEFVRAGHRMVGGSRDASAMAALQEEYGDAHCFAAVDVACESSVERWSCDALGRVGVPDLLINNAGIINTEAPLWEVSAAEFERVLAINVSGTHRILRHVLPAMLNNGRGVVVNLSSGWGRTAAPGVAPYCASKWAIEGMTAALAAELPPGMAAVPLNPGIIDTDMLREAWGDGARGYRSAAAWARTAAPFLLALGAADNGQALTAP